MPVDEARTAARSAAIKDMVLEALAVAGGADFLAEQALKNPNAFLTLVGKVLPLQVRAEVDGELVGEIVFRGLNG